MGHRGNSKTTSNHHIPQKLSNYIMNEHICGEQQWKYQVASDYRYPLGPPVGNKLISRSFVGVKFKGPNHETEGLLHTEESNWFIVYTITRTLYYEETIGKFYTYVELKAGDWVRWGISSCSSNMVDILVLSFQLRKYDFLSHFYCC